MELKNQISYHSEYLGHNIEYWKIKDYQVSRNYNKWFCTCSIKYKRNPTIECKHIAVVKRLLSTNNN